jgi:hypothetical protein
MVYIVYTNEHGVEPFLFPTDTQAFAYVRRISTLAAYRYCTAMVRQLEQEHLNTLKGAGYPCY